MLSYLKWNMKSWTSTERFEEIYSSKGWPVHHQFGWSMCHPFFWSIHCPFDRWGSYVFFLMHSMWMFVSDHFLCLLAVQSLEFHITTILNLSYESRCGSLCVGLIIGMCHLPHGWSNQWHCRKKYVEYSKQSCLPKWCHLCCKEADERQSDKIKGKYFVRSGECLHSYVNTQLIKVW